MKHLTLILTIVAAGVLLGAGTARADWGGHRHRGSYYQQPYFYPHRPYYCPAPVYRHSWTPYYGGHHRWTPYYGGSSQRWAPYRGFRGYGRFGGRW
jgi:hypothetical protein